MFVMAKKSDRVCKDSSVKHDGFATDLRVLVGLGRSEGLQEEACPNNMTNLGRGAEL